MNILDASETTIGSANCMRANYHSALDKCPANSVFGKEMVLPYLQEYADTSVSYKRKNQKLKDMMRENKGRIKQSTIKIKDC